MMRIEIRALNGIPYLFPFPSSSNKFLIILISFGRIILVLKWHHKLVFYFLISSANVS